MLTLAHPAPGDEELIHTGPVREAIVSWNARALDGALELRVNASDGRTSAWLPYAVFESERRASLDGRDPIARIETDVLRSDLDFVSVGVRSRGELDAVFVSRPDYGAPSAIVALPALELDVPGVSQYDVRYPNERGWCAPASLAMLLAYRSYPVDVPIVVHEVFDARYGGTGNWAFCAAFAARLGFAAAVVHLRDLAHAHAVLADDVPLALSIAWERGALPDAPVERSDGHIVVLCGIDPSGDAIVNDPARPGVRVLYPRAAFEAAWLGHGGVAIAVVPQPLAATLVRLANA